MALTLVDALDALMVGVQDEGAGGTCRGAEGPGEAEAWQAARRLMRMGVRVCVRVQKQAAGPLAASGDAGPLLAYLLAAAPGSGQIASSPSRT
jgi:hypothetical protein